MVKQCVPKPGWTKQLNLFRSFPPCRIGGVGSQFEKRPAHDIRAGTEFGVRSAFPTVAFSQKARTRQSHLLAVSYGQSL